VVIDTSALVAILTAEPEAPEFARLIQADAVRLVSAVSVLEAAMVIGARKGEVGLGELDLLLHRAAVEQIPFNREQTDAARRAWLLFGKGRHAAALNFGDCCAYALARVSGEPLLAKGNDFRRTDIRLAFPATAAN
jgi:ribonuclease VapC